MSGEKDLGTGAVSPFVHLANDGVEEFASLEREHSGNVFEEEELGRELIDKAKIMFEERVARVVKEALRGIDGKTLAGWATNKDIEFTCFESGIFTDGYSVEVLDGTSGDIDFGMVTTEGLASEFIEVIGKDARSPSLAETFRNPTGSGEKVDCLQSFHFVLLNTFLHSCKNSSSEIVR